MNPKCPAAEQMPPAVAVMIVSPARCMLGFGIARVPASGLLAERSPERLSHRPNRSGAMQWRVLSDTFKHLTCSTWWTTEGPARGGVLPTLK